MNEMSGKQEKVLLDKFSEDVGDFWATGKVPVLDLPLTPMEFLRDFVAPSRPCIIRNVLLTDQTSPSNCVGSSSRPHTPLHLTLDDIISNASPHEGDEDSAKNITVNVTPDGHGDCIRRVRVPNQNDDGTQGSIKEGTRTAAMFVKPLERQMTLQEFRRGLRLRRGQHRHEHECKGQLENRPQSCTEDSRAIYPLECSKGILAGSEDGEENSKEVLYYSLQNDCLRDSSEWGASRLWNSGTIPETIPFAEEAFGTGPPDAVNIWIGNEQAVSAMHMDHYENMFYVASGEKIFTLCPPADVPFLHWKRVPSGSFAKQGVQWNVIPDKDENSDAPSMIHWIEPDVHEYLHCCGRRNVDGGGVHDKDDNEPVSYCSCKYPSLSLAHPVEIKVKAGEMLYLPPLWFHRVTQTCETVGINYWYDMKFDAKWCYFQMLQRIALSDQS
jgi:hypothetical protein